MNKLSVIVAVLLTIVVIYAAMKTTILLLFPWFILLFWVFNKALFIESFKPNKDDMSPLLNLLFSKDKKEEINEDKNNEDSDK